VTAVEVHHVVTGPVDAPGVVGAVADAVVGRWLTAGPATADPALVERLLAMVRGTFDEGYAGCCEAIATEGQP
jgi:3-oxoadipate enol-lactonase/4-carboxymuconolactone decarboxylase